MASSDFDPSLADIRRQLVSSVEQVDDNIDDDTFAEAFSRMEGNGDMVEGHFASLSQYTRGELKSLSKYLGTSRLNYLEIEGVNELDWGAILSHEKCELHDLRVTIKSPRALADLAKALCNNTSLSILELDYYHIDDDSQDEEAEKQGYRNDISANKVSKNISESSLSLNEIFFEALMPLQHVVLRGITPIRPSASILFDDLDHATACSWQHLTIEDCDLTQENTTWLPLCITNLEEMVIRNCELSGATIQVLSEAYLTASATTRQNFSRKSCGERRRKNPLRVLNLSNNDWLMAFNDRNSDAEKENLRIVPFDEEDFFNYDSHCEERTVLSPLSLTGYLGSWLDSLSNLVELDLSENPQLFHRSMVHGNRGMDDLCGTVNQSLKRLSLRNCQLIPSDLHQIVSTFCWLEAIDLSENPALISNISLLSQLEYLTELVLENLIKYDTNDAFEFERRASDEEFDWETEGNGLTDLLLELLSGESASAPDTYAETRGIIRHRQKPLERINLSGNIMNKKSLHILSLFNSLEVLILMGCQINGDGVIELLSSTNNCSPRCSSLREVYLASNTIGDIGMLALAQSMKDQRLPLLKVLNLESNVISFEAFRVFVEEGLLHSNRIQYVQVSDNGAITRNQQHIWNEIEQKMEHNLLLNQAGRFTLFVDGDCNLDDENNDNVYEGNDGFCKNKISTNVWPLILEDADSIYGTDALFHFLNKRPDLFLASSKPQVTNLYHSTPLKSAPKSSSPNGFEDISSFLS